MVSFCTDTAGAVVQKRSASDADAAPLRGWRIYGALISHALASIELRGRGSRVPPQVTGYGPCSLGWPRSHQPPRSLGSHIKLAPLERAHDPLNRRTRPASFGAHSALISGPGPSLALHKGGTLDQPDRLRRPLLAGRADRGQRNPVDIPRRASGRESVHQPVARTTSRVLAAQAPERAVPVRQVAVQTNPTPAGPVIVSRRSRFRVCHPAEAS